MSTIPPLPPVVAAPVVAAPDGAPRTGRPRFRAVLAPLLPMLVLLGLCVAGLADPPAQAAGDQGTGSRGSVSRLHVPAEAPHLPAVPLTR